MDGITLTTVIEAVNKLGFPTVVCLWLMWRSMRSDKEHTTAVNSLASVMKELKITLDIKLDKIADDVEEIQDGLSGPHEIARHLPLPALALPKDGAGK